MRDAAVLVPFWRDDRGETWTLLIERTMRGRWGGQLACPGGFREPGDADLAAAAVRETGEEIGLRSERITVLEGLPAVQTHVPDVRVWPFVARVQPQQPWAPQESEVADVLEVRVRDLLSAAARTTVDVTDPDGTELRFPGIAIGSRTLWGLTLLILEPLLPDALTDRWAL